MERVRPSNNLRDQQQPTNQSHLTSVRRNLFQQNRSRRPAAPQSTSTTEITTQQRHSVEVEAIIVVRDRNGDVDFGDPPTLELDDERELPLDSRQESELERQRLAEAVRHHQINHSAISDHPDEILEVVKASLRAKVAALVEDNWMYDAEEPARIS